MKPEVYLKQFNWSNQDEIEELIRAAAPVPLNDTSILSFLDHTSLNDTDHEGTIDLICQGLRELYHTYPDLPSIPAVCIHPQFVARAKENLKGLPISIACVASAFPSGQTFTDVKASEVQLAVEAGADEVDVVINRGWAITGNWDAIHGELELLRKSAGDAHLKVILEISDLSDHHVIQQAALVACYAGADFVKTSTGKGKYGATLAGVVAMSLAVQQFQRLTGNQVGIKVAGGVSNTDDARKYAGLIHHLLGEAYLHPDRFRIGTSRLTHAIVRSLDGEIPDYFRA